MALRDFSKEELKRLFESRINSDEKMTESYRRELKEYLGASLDRFFDTLQLLKKYYTQRKGKILEVGAFPFFLTLALLEYGDDEIIATTAPANVWPGEAYKTGKKEAKIKAGGKEYGFPCWTVNAEKDRLPFDDKSFDVVVCAEVLEHLVHAPAAMACEMNRVLKDGGLLILTTPNALYWKYAYNLFFYGSWEPYSKYGVYGRHNRLWALNEVEDILTGNGFKIDESICAYAHARAKRSDLACKKKFNFINLIQDTALILSRLALKLPLPFLKKKDGDQLYVIAKKIGQPHTYSQEYLYRTNFIHEPDE